MNCLLARTSIKNGGCFGTLISEYGIDVAVTLEPFIPVIPEGIYTCQRGIHTIEDGKGPFETFEITGVEGHFGLLFHTGNWPKDTKGCILLGDTATDVAIENSADAFKRFMSLQKGVAFFQLSVQNVVVT